MRCWNLPYCCCCCLWSIPLSSSSSSSSSCTRPVARMDKALCSPHLGANKPNSSPSDRGGSSSRKPGRTGSHSPGSGSLGSGGSRGAVLGNSMNLQQQARRRQLEGVLSKYTNLIQGWQNRWAHGGERRRRWGHFGRSCHSFVLLFAPSTLHFYHHVTVRGRRRKRRRRKGEEVQNPKPCCTHAGELFDSL